MINITNECNTELMKRLENESIDIICIDPPYKYLKNQKLEVDFNEVDFFTEAKRLLTKDGFIIMFGRGVSFYRMNIILDDLGFTFKEEIIWNKVQSSSPVLKISRVHETISIWTKGKGIINESRIPYIEMKRFDFNSISSDINRIKSAIGNPTSLEDLKRYIKSGDIKYNQGQTRKHHVTVQGIFKTQDRSVKTMQAINQGMKEKSVINLNREHYDTMHPTQKPVRLLERLLILCLPYKPKNEIVIADFFGGSMSTMEAVYNLGLNGISCEIDKEYFYDGKKRILELTAQQKLF